MVGRRGPAQAAFTTPELIELGELAGADVIVDPADLDRGAEPTGHELGAQPRRCCASTQRASRRASRSGSSCGSSLSPVAILGEERVEAIELVHNRLEADASGSLRAVPTGERETLACGIVFRSVGYRGVALPGRPVRRGPRHDPRTRTAACRPPGVYVAGLDQARPERRDRHEQEGRDRDRGAAARGPA